jgi:tRNA modification GTPase
LQAAAGAALAHATTSRTAAILLDQHHGAFDATVSALLVALKDDKVETERLLRGLLEHSRLGAHLVTPWRIAVAGAPNVGKSSLVNALAGYTRCLVAPTAGTTRDVVTTLIAVDGWPVELADTAGLHEQATALEQRGIALARMAAKSADLCLWVLDASTPPQWPDAQSDTVHLVVNKIDLPQAWDLDTAGGAVQVSAQTSAGLEDLCRALSQWLVARPPAAGAAVPFTARLCEQLEDAWTYFQAGRPEVSITILESLYEQESTCHATR